MTDPSTFFKWESGQPSSTATGHIFTNVHQKAFNRESNKKKRQPIIDPYLTATPDLKMEIKQFRFDLVELCLANNWSPYALETEVSKAFFQKYSSIGAKSLPSTSDLMKDYIPQYQQMYENNKNSVIKGKSFSLVADGTTRVGSWVGFIA